MGLLNKEEWLEFERLCDAEGIPAGERARIVRDVFGKTEARLYEERRCKVVILSAWGRSVGTPKLKAVADS